jgi:glycerol-3-phosphate acyltransferase PlsY
MSNEPGSADSTSNQIGNAPPRPPERDLLPLPGLAAISLYLLLLAGVVILGVVAGHHYPPLFLLFAVGFISASAGLLMLFRWAWALALAAVFLLVIYNLWIFSTLHQGAALVQGLLNLVFFLYLVRPEVREKLR